VVEVSGPLIMLPVTDAQGAMVFLDGRPNEGATRLTFLSNERGADVLDAIRTCEKDIRFTAPNCEIANFIGQIGDQIERLLTANENTVEPG